MIAAVASVGALLLSAALLLMGNGLQTTLLPVRADIEAFATVQIGVMGSAYFVGFVVGCISVPHSVRWVGHIRAFTAMVAIASAVPLVHLLVIHPVTWWILRAMTGFCLAGLYLVIESWLNERSTNETRGTVLSVYTIIQLTVITLGQLMITLADPSDFALFGIASIIVSVAAVPVALTTQAAPAPLAQVRIRPLHLLRSSPVGVVGCLAVGLANGGFWTLSPAFVLGSGLDVSQVAFFMSLAVIAGAVGQWPLGRLSDRMDRRVVIIGASIGGAAAGLALTWAGWTASPLLLPLAFGFGLFAFPLYALCVAHTNDFIAADEFVETSSGLLLANGLGSAIGPLAASALMRGFGPSGLFMFSAGVHAAMAGFAAYRMRKRAAPVAEHSGTFIATPETASSITTLDPRLEGEEQAEASQP